MHKRKWMTISSTNPVAWWTTTELEIWRSHGLWHFSGFRNLFCRLHNEIILVGPSIVTTEQNSDPTKYNGLSSTIWHYLLCHELWIKENLCYNNVEGRRTLLRIPYRTKYQALSKAKIYGTLCNFVHRAIRESSPIDIGPVRD